MTLQVGATISSSGPTDAFYAPNDRAFNISVTGDGSATFTCTIERLVDGVTWVPMTWGGVPYRYSSDFSEPFAEAETDVKWRLNFSAVSGGNVVWFVRGKVTGRPI